MFNKCFGNNYYLIKISILLIPAILRALARALLDMLFFRWLHYQLPQSNKAKVWEKSWGHLKGGGQTVEIVEVELINH